MIIKTCPESFKKSFLAAVRFSDSDRRQNDMSLCAFFWALVILLVVSVGMLWLGDKLNAKGMVVTRFTAKGQATLTGQISHPTIGRDQITVMMYDQQFLGQTGSAWPLSYQDHADWLLRLASDPNARPKAIMLDITFGQERADATLPALKQALCKVQNEFKVPVFLAALPSPETGKLTVRSGLGPKPGSAEPPCFTLVGVDYFPDSLDGVAWEYPMTRRLVDGKWKDGPAEPTEAAAQPPYRSAAMAMAQDAAHIELGKENGRLAVVWGLKSAPQADRPDSLSHCKPGAYDGWRYLPGVLRQFFRSTPPPVCPYHRTLSMAQVSELPEQALASYLAGRYVLVGANVPAYNDFANSPVHGLIPGVHLHAMALDNLLTYQGAYKQSAEWESLPSMTLLLLASLSVSAVFLTRVLWWWLTGFLRDRIPDWRRHIPARLLPDRLKQLGERIRQSPIARRSWQATVMALDWLARMTLQTIVAMTLISLLQKFCRVGMLPVVELVTMTLIAEGLNYMKKLRWLLDSDPEKPVADAASEPIPLSDQKAHP